MKITTSMSTSSYESIYNQVQKDYLTLNSKRSSFSSTTSDATTKLNATDFSGWEDSVATKMKQAVDDFKGTVTSVESDLTAGNYNVLLTKISELVSALEKCKSIRNSLNNKEYSRRNTTRYEEDGKTETQNYKQLTRDINSLNNDLTTWVNKCNRLIGVIEAIEFMKEIPGESSSGDEPVPVAFDDNTETSADGGDESEAGSSVELPDDDTDIRSEMYNTDFTEGEEGEYRTLSDDSEMYIESRETVNGVTTETGQLYTTAPDGSTIEYDYTVTTDGYTTTMTVTYEGEVVYSETRYKSQNDQFYTSTSEVTDGRTGEFSFENRRDGGTTTFTYDPSDPTNYSYTDDSGEVYTGDSSAEPTTITVTTPDGQTDSYTIQGDENDVLTLLNILVSREENRTHHLNDAGWAGYVSGIYESGEGQAGNSYITITTGDSDD